MSKKTSFVWGLFVTFLALAAPVSAAVSDYAQTKKVTVVAQNKPLKEIFSSIEKQSEYIFLYADGVINPSRRVSVNLSNVTVDKVLDVVLASTGVTYTINSNSRQITLSARPAKNLSASGPKKISGVVVDERNEPVIGANVSIKGTTNGTITDMDGSFVLEAAPGTTMLISYIGYSPKEISVTSQSDYRISIAEDMQKLDEVVVVGYGTQKKESLTGSVSMVKAAELTKAPVANVSNMLAGRMPGLVTLQGSGMPGRDHPTMSIRGFGQAIYIVDGVEKDFTQIDPSQIESISILKDGAAAIYGSRAGNGVILVTTKRGIEQKPTVSLNASYTLQGITMMPKPVSSGQYAEMARETWINSGKPESTAPFTREQIQKFYAGGDPQYPNTDWRKEAIRDWAPLQQHNVSIRGGNKAIRYFGSMGYMNQESMWKSGKGGGYERYNFQSNIDATITDALTMEINVSYILGQTMATPRQGDGQNGVFHDYWNTLPIYPARLPDPNKLPWAEGLGLGGVHIVTNTDHQGYNKSTNQSLFGSGAIKYDFSKHGVKGLTAKAFFNYHKENNLGKVFTKSAKTYIYDVASDIYTMKSGEGAKPQISQSRNDIKNMTGQFSLNYDNTFGAHHISGLALYEAISYQSERLSAGRDNVMSDALQQLFAGDMKTMKNDGSETTMGRSSFVARLNYDYESKYLVEAIIRADASAKFAAGARTGWFPSVSLGWRLSKETFMENLSFLDDLKLRLSYGNMGDDSVGDFQYLSGYKLSGSYLFGQNVVNGIETTGMANPWLTWKKIAVYNIGFDYSFFNRKLYGSLEGFYRKVSGIPAQNTASVSNTFGANLPTINLNETSNRGFDFTAGSAFQAGKVHLDLSANLSWTREKYDFYSESDYVDPDQKRINQKTGHWTNITFGYRTNGLFTSQQEIDNLKFDQDQQGNKTIRPGDIRFVDINDDKILDWKDQVELGLGTTPNWMFGFNINARYRDFDFSALFQGAFGFYKSVNVQHQNNVQPEVVYNERWSESNNVPDALFPRLGGAAQNGLTSDYFFKPADYLRLKTLTVGYNLPRKFMDKARLQGCRIYFAANNLFTLSGLNKYGVDPESPSGMGGLTYPQQRTLSLGLNVSF